MIAGIGVDVVELARFERSLARTPRLAERLFAQSERMLPPRSLAGRFAAKEALIKAIGSSNGLNWHDMSVIADAQRAPRFALTGAAAALAAELGLCGIHLTISHDAGVAVAMVVLER